MKLSKIILIVYLFIFYPLDSLGQQGCLINGTNDVYTTKNSSLLNSALELLFGNPVYLVDVKVPTETACINNAKTKYLAGTASCNVCPMGYSYLLGLLQGCNGTTWNGKIATLTVVACPIDDYTNIFAIIAAAIGVFYIYRKEYMITPKTRD